MILSSSFLLYSTYIMLYLSLILASLFIFFLKNLILFTRTHAVLRTRIQTKRIQFAFDPAVTDLNDKNVLAIYPPQALLSNFFCQDKSFLWKIVKLETFVGKKIVRRIRILPENISSNPDQIRKSFSNPDHVRNYFIGFSSCLKINRRIRILSDNNSSDSDPVQNNSSDPDLVKK